MTRGFSECVLAVSSGVLVVTGVSDFPYSIMLNKVLLSSSNYEIVEPQSFSLSRKRQRFFFVGSQEDMNYDGTSVKAPPPEKD